jgi:mono/diheme cytochrome c family protein
MTPVPRLFRSAVLVLLVAGSSPTHAQTPADDAKVEKGRTVYQYWCAPCHSSGRGNPGTAALAAKYKTRQPPLPALLTERTDLTPQSIRFFVRQGVSVMAPFRKTEITDADLDALSAFLTKRK